MTHFFKYVSNINSLDVATITKGPPEDIATGPMYAELVGGIISNDIRVFFKDDPLSFERHYYTIYPTNTNETNMNETSTSGSINVTTVCDGDME